MAVQLAAILSLAVALEKLAGLVVRFWRALDRTDAADATDAMRLGLITAIEVLEQQVDANQENEMLKAKLEALRGLLEEFEGQQVAAAGLLQKAFDAVRWVQAWLVERQDPALMARTDRAIENYRQKRGLGGAVGALLLAGTLLLGGSGCARRMTQEVVRDAPEGRFVVVHFPAGVEVEDIELHRDEVNGRATATTLLPAE